MAGRVRTTWLNSELAHLEHFPSSKLVRPPGTFSGCPSRRRQACCPSSLQIVARRAGALQKSATSAQETSAESSARPVLMTRSERAGRAAPESVRDDLLRKRKRQCMVVICSSAVRVAEASVIAVVVRMRGRGRRAGMLCRASSGCTCSCRSMLGYGCVGHAMSFNSALRRYTGAARCMPGRGRNHE